MSMVSPFPPAPPSISGSVISIDAFLRTPARVQRVVQNLAAQRFIADLIFGPGPRATGGAVLYDQVGDNDLFLTRDVQQIRPGQEFPILTDDQPVPKMAAIAKWGGRVFITFEQRDRNATDVVDRELRKLANTVVRKVDSVAVAALLASPTRTMAGSDWTSASAATKINNIVDAAGLVNNPDLGYETDAVFVNPTQGDELIKDKDVRDALQGNTPTVILRDGNLGRMLNMDFFRSNRVPAGTALVLQRRIVGGISDEVPFATKSYLEEGSEKIWVQGSRRLVPYVTDPLAVTVLTGI